LNGTWWNCESLTPTRGSDRHLPGNPQPYACTLKWILLLVFRYHLQLAW